MSSSPTPCAPPPPPPPLPLPCSPQTRHAEHTYPHTAWLSGGCFADMFRDDPQGGRVVDFSYFDRVQQAPSSAERRLVNV